MIKDQLVNNENKKPNSYEIEKLKKDFPNYFDRDGNFLIDKFKKMLIQEEIDIEKEGYELNFLGKNYAKLQTSLETETVIVPDIEHNNKNENINSENLYIVGDNIDAIKHLLNSYSNKIKCIYIDPPYNTGSDGFVYPDNFKFTKENLAKSMGIEEYEAERILNLSGKSTHSAWMTFMYSRLMLAKDLLSDDGVIFISIDDNEMANLKLICDEIYGENNFVATIVWEKVHTRKNSAIYFSESHDYILCIAKDKDMFDRNLIPRQDTSAYQNPDNDPRGPWKADPIYANNPYDANYTIEKPNGIKLKRPEGRYWRYSKDSIDKAIDEKRIIWGKEDSYPMLKRYLSEVADGLVPVTLFDRKFAGDNMLGNNEVKGIFKKEKMFSYPKPTRLIKRLIQIGSSYNDIILDFFSGSATTAHATMKLNSEDNGNRKYIMVQLPEVIDEGKPAYKAGYKTIDEIGRKRIEKAAEKIKEETNSDIDYGYKLYRLEKLENKTLDKIIEFDPHENFIYDDMTTLFEFNGVSGRDTILSTWLNIDGYGLSLNSEKIKLHQYEADIYKDTLYIIDPGLTSQDAMELIKKIEKDEINLSRIVIYPYSVVFNVIHELKKNMKSLKNGKTISLIERY